MKHLYKYFTALPCWLLLAVAFLFAPEAKAQPTLTFGNEWINYGQQYHKLSAARPGVYRVTQAYLQSKGITVQNGSELKVYRRGREVPVYVSNNSGAFGPNDYLEFVGERNDGVLDSAIYKRRADQINPFFSLYTDTAAYFLTQAAGPSLRLVPSASTAQPGQTTLNYHIQKRIWYNTGSADTTYKFQRPNRYQHGHRYEGEDDVRLPWGDEGEGYSSNQFAGTRFLTNTNSYDSTRTARNTFTIDSIANFLSGADTVNAPKPVLKVNLVGYLSPGLIGNQHIVDIRVGKSTTRFHTVGRVRFDLWKDTLATVTVNFSDIDPATGKILVWLQSLNHEPGKPAGFNDNISLAYATLDYPQGFDLGGKSRHIFPTGNGPFVINVSNAPANAVLLDLSDPTNARRITPTGTGTSLQFIVPAVAAGAHFYITSSSAFYTPVRYKAVTFTQPNTTADYLIVTHPRMRRIPGQPGIDPVQEYADFRVTSGNFQPSIVEVDDLYDQFHYGEKSSVAIRHYFDYMRAASSSSDPKYALMIGKGIMAGGGQNTICQKSRFGEYCTELDLVPPFNFPGSDLPYVTDWKHGNYVPYFPIGRIAAQSSEQVLDYLDKAQTHENLPDSASWRKNILHLGGGKTVSERNTYLGYLNTYKAIAEGACFGGNVLTKIRQNLNLLFEVINVSDEVNRGLSLITFFGHSSQDVSDLEIGYASAPVNGYHNEGKYPMILINGCASGDIFRGGNDAGADSFGEDWILAKKKGAILFLGHTGQGYPGQLNKFSGSFYRYAFQDSSYYGRPIGEIHQQVIRHLQDTIGANLANDKKFIGMLSEMTLQGDPYLRLFSPRKPDLTFSRTNALSLEAVSPFQISADAENIDLVINVRNLGSSCAESDSVTIQVKRSFGSTPPAEQIITETFRLTRYQDQFRIRIPHRDNAAGLNVFEVTLDSPQQLDEFNELNNVAVLQYNLPSSGLVALLPAEFSIVSTNQVTFQAQATDVQAMNKQYYFEVDTAYQFTNPIANSGAAPITGNALATWSYTLPNVADSTVFYWRVRFFDDTIWAKSSFAYIPNSNPGWAQLQFGQFLSTLRDDITLNPANRRWSFEARVLPITIKTVGAGKQFSHPPYGIYLNGAYPFVGSCGFTTGSGQPNHGFHMIVLDQYTLEPKVEAAQTFTCPDPAAKSYYRFFYTGTNNTSDVAAVNAIQKVIDTTKVGDYIVLMSANYIRYSNLSPTLKDMFRDSLGSQLITTLQDSMPWAMIARKQGPGQTFPVIEMTSPAASPQDSVILNYTLNSNTREGTITSTVIGPATSWDTLYHKVTEMMGAAQGQADEQRLEIIGLDSVGNSKLLGSVLTNADVPLAGMVNVNQYPYLQLKLHLSDTLSRTAPQLQNWIVTYQGVPEGILRADVAPGSNFSIPNQQQGTLFDLPVAFENISSKAFTDSIPAVLTVNGSTGMFTDTLYYPPLAPGQQATVIFKVNTTSITGAGRLQVFVNPRILPEQYYFNNLLQLPFRISGDDQHPLLDVAFDGVHIMDGDIVSPDPEIVIALKDENQFRFVNDTSDIEIFLVRPGAGASPERIYLTHASTTPSSIQYDVSWSPAAPGQDFRVNFNPKHLPNGIYTLMVQGTDAAGNKAGVTPYKITFEVINESTISNFYPYPNPFSSSCSFVFTLTGSRIPDQMKIQVLTMTGKVVKEISREELGALRIGVNGNRPTDYHWDGKDEYGDQLANGVYLYRVVIGNKGEDFEARRTAGDKSFKKEYGKLYILR